MLDNLLIEPNEKTEFFVIKKDSKVYVMREKDCGCDFVTIFDRDTTFSKSWFVSYSQMNNETIGVFNHKFDDIKCIFTDQRNITELEELVQ